VVVRLLKGVHQAEDLERLHRLVRVRPGNLDLYLEILGVGRVRRAVYKAGIALKIRHDDRLVPDLEAAVGPGNVRLLGQGGATTRVESRPAASPRPLSPADEPPPDDPDEP
jgi:DNA polymerase-3 subunit alpha